MSEFSHQRTLTITVPHGKGGSTDTAVRILAEYATKHIGMPMRIINLSDINGADALDLMVDSIRALPDGYSLSTANTSVILSPIFGNTKYRYIDEIRPLLMYAQAPFMLAVRGNSEIRTLDDFLRIAGKDPNRIRAGNSGLGNMSHLVMEILCAQTGIRPAIITYSSGKELVQAMLRAEVDCMVSNAVDLQRLLRNGRAHVIAIADDEDHGETATFVQAGIDIVAHLRQGIGISPKVPQAWYDHLHQAFYQMANEPKLKAAITAVGLEWKYMSGEDYAALWRQEDHRWRTLLSGELFEQVSNMVMDAQKGGV